MLLIHVSGETERLKYIFDFIFSDILRIPYALTTDRDSFLGTDAPRISYGVSRLGNALHIPSTDLLFQKQVEKKQLDFSKWDNLPVFFAADGGDIPFDIFAASFYLVSRYEEYLPHLWDSHKRYRPEDSAAFKGGFLNRPMVNVWIWKLKKLLTDKYPALHVPQPGFSFIPSIDIDNAYAYKYKGWGRICLSLAKSLLKLQFKKFLRRLKVHAGYRKDPYDSYRKQSEVHEKYNLKPLYFILLGDYGRYDRNLSHKNKHLVRLVRTLHQKGLLGMHPSYNSNNSEEQLHKEKKRLENIIGETVVRSRQHYVKLHIPETYRNLIKTGIKEDYSMGYPSMSGFRASTGTPFYFFDLTENQKKELKIFPFVAMDTTLKQYMKMRSKQVIPHLAPVVREIKETGGVFVFIFHNESIGNEGLWRNWGKLYEEIIKLAVAGE